MEKKTSATQDALLINSSIDLIDQLTKKRELIQVKQFAYGYWSKENGEQFQIQVLVTRKIDHFLDPLQTEEIYS